MTRRAFLWVASVVLSGVIGALTLAPSARGTADILPARLTDEQFWKLSTDLSEPDGYFRSDNLLSNEASFQHVIPDLVRTARAGRVYLGVGPEQNFTYIVALKSAMAFIVDIRRGNLLLHLMYKALFELSSDRADFVSRLFSRARPPGLTTGSTPGEIFAAYLDPQLAGNDSFYKQNLQAMRDLLVVKHRLPLSTEELQGIEFVYSAFYENGPEIQYSPTRGASRGGGNLPNYATLMTATDDQLVPRSYLATEANFTFLKDLETRNMLVPVVGNFAGPKAIRAVGQYLKDHGIVVSAFYLSNVEQYLGDWSQFCANVATLPLDETSMFIRSTRGGGRAGLGTGRSMFSSSLGRIQSNIKTCG